MGADVPTIRIQSNPILVGYGWSFRFSFCTGTANNAVPIDLSPYAVRFSIRMGGDRFDAGTVQVSGGMVIASFSDSQTLTMIQGVHKGNLFLERLTNKEVSYLSNIEVPVVNPIPLP